MRDRVSDRAIERSIDRPSDRPSDGPSDRSSDPASDRAIERSTERYVDICSTYVHMSDEVENGGSGRAKLLDTAGGLKCLVSVGTAIRAVTI